MACTFISTGSAKNDIKEKGTEELPDPKYNFDAIQKSSLYRLGSLKGPLRTRPMKRIKRVRKKKEEVLGAPDGQYSEDESSKGSISSRDMWNSNMDEYEYEEEEQVIIPAKPPSQALYLNTCKQLGVTPASYFSKHLLSDQILMRNHILGHLGAKACAITLVNNMSVTRLDLSGNEIGPEGAMCMAHMITDNVNLTEIRLADNNIGRIGLEAICEAMKINEQINTLDIGGNNLEDKDANYIADLLENSVTIKELYLGHNNLRENGAQIIAKSLGENFSLEVLDLSWNHIRMKGAVAIAKTLKKNKSLLKLNLAWNGFYLEGCTAIKDALQHNSTLLDLDLSSNRIDHECLETLLKGCKKNSTLTALRLNQNPITTEGAITILKTLETSKESALREIDISGQSVDARFLNLLNSLQESRDLSVKHGMIMNQDILAKPQDDFLNEDPMMVLMEFMRLRNLRLVDLFTSLDKDGSNTLTRDEFRDGLLSVNVPMSAAALNRLVDKLDADGDGEVDYAELIAGKKEHQRKLNRLTKANKDHHIPMEDTELGKLTTKLQALMAFRKLPKKAKVETVTKGNQTTKTPPKVIRRKSSFGVKAMDKSSPTKLTTRGKTLISFSESAARVKTTS